jgi:assimilatory nitrate reductase catalytic subunit
MKNSVKSTCCYCGVGCGLLIETEDGRITGVKGDPEHPANQGRLCTKGATLAMTATPEYRLLHPERRLRSTLPGEQISWDAALEESAARFAAIIQAHGPDSVAFYISGQLMTEDYYVFNKLAKGLIGTNNVDTNSRLCMSSAVVGYKKTLGADAPPCCYEDIAEAQVIFIAGANPALAHPIVFRRIEDARAANPQLKIIVADPRRTETAEIADLHLPLKPGTDIALFNGMLHVLIEEGMLNAAFIREHTQGFSELAEKVKHYSPAVVADICGLDVAAIVKAARWFGASKAALSLYCQGLNQSAQGSWNNAGLIHLHLATGQIGKSGAGPFSLTGQPNAMGGREVGGLANLLSAHRDLANPQHRAEVAELWGIPSVPEKPGKSAVDLFKSLKTGQIKAVWIACTNPAQSLPNQTEVREALRAAEYVVLQEAYGNTDTADYADLLLPASGWGEKYGTVTNSERRITYVAPAVVPPGEARHDWEIVVDFARRLGQKLGHPLRDQLFPYTDAESIFNEHRATTLGRDLDIGGLSYDFLKTHGPQQWPFPAGASQGKKRLYEDGIFPTADGKASFIVIEAQGSADRLTAEFPISLLSGRMRDQWHGMSRTGSVPRLFNLEDEPLLKMHPCDMRHRQLAAGDLVKINNGRGEITVRVAEQAGLRKGCAWLPMHWGSQFMNSAGFNALACDAIDPYSMQPELKHAAVQISPAALPHPLAIIRRCATQSEAQALLQKAKILLADFPYASLSLYGRRSSLVVFRAATATPLSEENLAKLDQLFALDGEEGAIFFADLGRQISKKAIAKEGRLFGVRLSGEALAQLWLKESMAEDELEASLLRFALAPTAKPPVSVAARTIICKCADVSDEQIRLAAINGADLPALQETLKCGTFCGSCVPDIKRILLKTKEVVPV